MKKLFKWIAICYCSLFAIALSAGVAVYVATWIANTFFIKLK